MKNSFQKPAAKARVADQAITDPDQDLLGVGNLRLSSRELHPWVCPGCDDWCVTVKWGAGKTSFVELVRGNWARTSGSSRSSRGPYKTSDEIVARADSDDRPRSL
jgi:hypothetical protein